MLSQLNFLLLRLEDMLTLEARPASLDCSKTHSTQSNIEAPAFLPPEHRVQAGRRFIAAWAYDFLASFWLALIVLAVLSPLIAATTWRTMPPQVVALTIFLTRDFWFQGRGVGKNFLHLQVVDFRSGKPASLWQSIKRNLVLIGPYLLYQYVAQTLIYFHVQSAQAFLDVLKTLCFAYAGIMLPVELFMLHSGRGLRVADRLAGTIVVWRRRDFRKLF